MAEAFTPDELLGLFRMTPERIVAAFRRKGHQLSFDWRDVWQAEHARAFTVAKAMRDDVLQLLRQGVDMAISEGWSAQRFLSEMTPRLQKAGWWGKDLVLNPATGLLEEVQLGSPWRLNTIFRTNHSVAFERGRYETQKASAERRPIWVYDAINDSRTRDAHRAMDNRAYRHDDPIWATIRPPSGYNCRCTVRALTEEEAAGEGLEVKTSAESLPPENFPDKGWEYNPAAESPRAFQDRIDRRRKPSLPDV